MSETVTVAHVGDTHIVKSSRWDELRRVHDWIADDLAVRKPSLITHGGDVFHKDTTPEERNVAHDLVIRLARIAPVLIVRGNHDPVGEIEVFRKLRSRYPIIIEEEVGLHDTGKVLVVALAWPRKAELLSRLSADTSLRKTQEGGQEALRSVLRGYGMQLATEYANSPKPRLLVSHAMVRGSITSTGQPLVGADFEVSLNDLELVQCDLIAVSHIHKGQEFRCGSGTPVIYPGSTYRVAYGELEQKGYLWIEFIDRKPRWEHVIVPATPMILLEGVYKADSQTLLFEKLKKEQTESNWKGADIRLRYTFDAEHKEAAARAAEMAKARMLRLGAIKVTVEDVKIISVKAKVPEIAEAVTTEDKLDLYWKATGKTPIPELRDSLLVKVREVEQETIGSEVV